MKTPIGHGLAARLEEEATNLTVMEPKEWEVDRAADLMVVAAFHMRKLQDQLLSTEHALKQSLKVDHADNDTDEPAAPAVPAAAKCRHDFSGPDGVCLKCGAKRTRKPRTTQQPLPGGGS